MHICVYLCLGVQYFLGWLSRPVICNRYLVIGYRHDCDVIQAGVLKTVVTHQQARLVSTDWSKLENAMSILRQFKNGVGQCFCSKEKISPVFLVHFTFMRRLRAE